MQCITIFIINHTIITIFMSNTFLFLIKFHFTKFYIFPKKLRN
jgi:hypothetical protein